jgi:hypothetical protein
VFRGLINASESPCRAAAFADPKSMGARSLARSLSFSLPSIAIDSSCTWQLSFRGSDFGRPYLKLTQSHREKLLSPFKCRNRTGKRRFHRRSAVTPAQQTVSPYFLLGCGKALIRMTMRSDGEEIVITPREIAVEIKRFESHGNQLIAHDRAMTVLRIALKTEQAH